MAVRDVVFNLDIKTNAKTKANEFGDAADNIKRKGTSLEQSIKKLGIAMGAMFSVALIKQGAQAAIREFAEFEKALASLSALTGAEGKELEFLKNQAIEMGAQFGIAGRDVLKAFELAGSARPELLKNGEALAKVTKEAITLSKASGLDLPTSINSLAGALNQFGLSSDNAGRVINALAAGSKEGAAAIPALSDAIQVAGTVMSSSNVGFEEGVGLLEVLGEKAIQGAEAGTALRNFLLLAQKNNIGFKNGVFDVNEALDQLAKKNLSVAEMTKIFGARTVTTAQILINGRAEVERYTKAVTGTSVAQEQARKNTETLAAEFDKFDAVTSKTAAAIGAKLAPALVAILKVFTETRSESEQLTDTWKEQKATADDLNTNLLPLTDRYDELAAKGELNKDEQDELNTIIKTIAATVPTAITEFNAYGEALKLNTGLVRENVEAQTRMAELTNRDAIAATKDEILRLSQQVQNTTKILRAGGTEFAIYSELGRKTGTQFKENTAEDILKFQGSIKDTNTRIGQMVLQLKTLGIEFTESEKSFIRASVGFDVFGQSTEDAKKTALELSEELGEGESGKPGTLTGSIAFLEERVKKLGEELTKNFVPGTEGAIKKQQELEQATAQLELALRAQQSALTEANIGEAFAPGAVDSFAGTTLDPDTVQDRAHRSAQIQIEQAQISADYQADLLERQIEAEEAAAERRKEFWAGIANAGVDAANMILKETLISRDKDLNNLEKQKAEKIRLAGDNETAVRAIEEDFARKAFDLKKKEAREQILLDTATAIIKSLATLGFPAGLLASVPIGILSAAQLAVVGARGFAQGTENVTGGQPGRDSVHALLMPGEAVLPAAMNRRYAPTRRAMFAGFSPDLLNSFIQTVSAGGDFHYTQSNSSKLDDQNIVREIRGLRSDGSSFKYGQHRL